MLVHLRPYPIVARVSSAVPFPDGPHPDDVSRELEVAGFAARAGAPVIPPASGIDPGPHSYGERVIAFWRYVEPHGEPDPDAAGRGLRLIHEALADLDARLPPRGHRADVETMLATLGPSRDVDLLRALAASGSEVDGQALHGDAHLGNCLQSSAGPLWHDFETACRGPREYDLAALVLADRRTGMPAARQALAAYGRYDEALLEAMLPVYASWVYASMLVALPRRPDLEPILADRLAWLRRDARRRGLA